MTREELTRVQLRIEVVFRDFHHLVSMEMKIIIKNSSQRRIGSADAIDLIG